MPWWIWLLIWTALIALSLLYIILLLVMLWRRLVNLGAAAAEAAGQLSELETLVAVQNEQEKRLGELLTPAIFANPQDVASDYREGKEERKAARIHARIQRKTERGQLQSLKDLRRTGKQL